MPGRWSEDFRFVAAAYCRDRVVLAMTTDDAAAEAEDLTVVAAWRGPSKWLLLEEPYIWTTVDAISLGEMAGFLGANGELLLTDGEKATMDLITRDSQETRGALRSLRCIAGKLYAVGMGRQVYVRKAQNQWICLDEPIRPSAGDDSIIGFNAVDGYSSNDIYAVGFGGEIWRRTKSKWAQIDSPTNLPLCGLLCDEGGVYICGRNGMFIVGKNEEWFLLAPDEIDDDLWSIVRFRDRIFVLGTYGLYVLEDHILVREPIVGESFGFGGRLFVGNNQLWLVGPKDLLSYNGDQWIRID